MASIHPKKSRWRIRSFALLTVVAALAMYANWPRLASNIKPDIKISGFPYTFAVWRNGELQVFAWFSFAIDVGLVLAAFLIVVAATRHRSRSTPSL